MKVVKNEPVKEDVFLLTVEDQRISATAEPGQFVLIRITSSPIPLLMRPFSVHYADGGKFEILYKVIGIGTKILSTYKPGDELDIIGPLGNGFDTSNKVITSCEKITLLAGGIGVAPLYFLAHREKQRELTMLIGASTKGELLCETKFAKLGKVIVSTEDGSCGVKGVVTDLLETISGKCRGGVSPPPLIACGPPQMLKTVRSYALRHSIPCQLCLEGHMACGIGVCLGCAVRSKGGYKHICKDGPVFWADEVEI